jgi:sortase A
MSRRRIGLTLFIAGGLLFSFAGSRYAMGAAAQDEARRQWEDAEARTALSRAEALAGHQPTFGALVHGAPVARLIIPRIQLDEIVLEGVDDDALNGGPGHFPGSALPGQPGNAVVSAHRDRHFRRLGELAVGDTVITESGAVTTRWVIARRRVIDKDRPALFPTRQTTLTLTTCWPIQYFGTAPDRLIITAVPLR